MIKIEKVPQIPARRLRLIVRSVANAPIFPMYLTLILLNAFRITALFNSQFLLTSLPARLNVRQASPTVTLICRSRCPPQHSYATFLTLYSFECSFQFAYKYRLPSNITINSLLGISKLIAPTSSHRLLFCILIVVQLPDLLSQFYGTSTQPISNGYQIATYTYIHTGHLLQHWSPRNFFNHNRRKLHHHQNPCVLRTRHHDSFIHARRFRSYHLRRPNCSNQHGSILCPITPQNDHTRCKALTLGPISRVRYSSNIPSIASSHISRHTVRKPTHCNRLPATSERRDNPDAPCTRPRTSSTSRAVRLFKCGRCRR